MIDIAGSTHRSYEFPADPAAALDYYADFPRVVSCLSLIGLVKQYGSERYRLVYRSTELGVYRVRIYCDVQVSLDRDNRILRVTPWNGPAPVAPLSGMSLTQAQGQFASESVFHEAGGRARIDYRLDLRARLPVPLGLSLVPTALLEGAARAITARRMQDIIDAFIARSLTAYDGGRRA